jgi:hypothetical protein
MSGQRKRPQQRKRPAKPPAQSATDARAAESPVPDEAAIEAAKAAIRSGPFTPPETITGSAPDGAVPVPDEGEWPPDEEQEAAAAEQAIAAEPELAIADTLPPPGEHFTTSGTEHTAPDEPPRSELEPESPVESARARLAGAAQGNAMAEQRGAASTDVAQVEALIGIGELLCFIAERLERDARDRGGGPLEAMPLPGAMPRSTLEAGQQAVATLQGMVSARDLRLVPGMIAPEQADPPMPPLYSPQVQQGEATYTCVVCGQQPPGVTPAMHAAIAHPPERVDLG